MEHQETASLNSPSVLSFQIRNASVMDGFPEDNLPYDLIKDYLHHQVSSVLQIKYLSRCNQQLEQIKKKRVYNGVLLTKFNRLFLSIPTYQQQTKRLTNVHYLLDSNAAYTTFTQKAKCALNQSEYSEQKIFNSYRYCIGGKWIHLRNRDRDELGYTPRFGNANLLGADFLRLFRKATIDIDYRQSSFKLQLCD